MMIVLERGKFAATIRDLLCVGFALFTLCPVSTAHPGGPLEAGSQKWWHGWEDLEQPKIKTPPLNLTAVVGHTVTLPCTVNNLGSRTVSWIRSRDLTVLSVERITVTTDPRISVVHREETEDWVLELTGVLPTDAGTYECQVNTHPKMSTKIRLKVLSHADEVSILDIPVSDTGVITAPADTTDIAADDGSILRVRVLGRRWVRMEAGSTLRLVCEASGKPLKEAREYSSRHNDPLITWTLDGIPVTELWPHTKVMVRESWSSTTVESEVWVQNMNAGDIGTFACIVPNAPQDRVTVTLLPYDGTTKIAAADRGSFSRPTHPHTTGTSGSTAAVGAAGRAAILSGAIILLLLIVQAALCIFYIKKI